MDQEQKSLDKMTVKELREVAKELPEITGISTLKKDQLLEAIKKAQGVNEEQAAKPKKAKKVNKAKSAPLNTVKDVKVRIAELRNQKQEASAENDKKTATILRRKINILKKKTRKMSKAS